MIRKIITLALLAVPFTAIVQADEVEEKAIEAKARTICPNIVPINEIPGGGVLYKSSNLHGGRGPTFIVQNVAERTNKKVIEIRNARCEPIATIGLFATDQPYGSRYYMRTGGTGQDSDELFRLAMLVGSPNILVEGVNKWIRVRNPNERDGMVHK
ncbi:MAG: hypothetical protein IT290_05680 [Deltaproteobacteria bacterium]|nr:hypothetical protein [Deltaproteobacteria bacterium]